MTTKAVHSQTTDNSAAVVGSRSLRVRRVITTRAGGFSTGRYHGLNLSLDVGDNPVTVAHNRERLAEKLHLPLERFVYMEQLQSPHVSVIEATADTRFTAPIPATDAVVTTAPELALVVLTADAVPVLLGDDEAGVIAALHGSPFGIRAGLIANTVDDMQQLGADPHRMHALLGPSATGRNMRVSEAVAADMENRVPHTRSKTPQGQPSVDLRRGIAYQLVQAGLAGVTIDPRCTIEDPAFFSTYREGKTGCQAGVIWRSND